jgi:hypothetical protein
LSSITQRGSHQLLFLALFLGLAFHAWFVIRLDRVRKTSSKIMCLVNYRDRSCQTIWQYACTRTHQLAHSPDWTAWRSVVIVSSERPASRAKMFSAFWTRASLGTFGEGIRAGDDRVCRCAASWCRNGIPGSRASMLLWSVAVDMSLPVTVSV